MLTPIVLVIRHPETGSGSVQPEPTQMKFYKALFDEELAKMKAEYGSRTSDVKITDGEVVLHNPNLYPFLT